MQDAEYLSGLKKGETAIVKGFSTEDVPVKLYEMGILPGISVQLLHIAPFGGPYYISVGNSHYRLALRRKEAGMIMIERADG